MMLVETSFLNLLCALVCLSAPQEPADFRVEPQEIPISLFYDGMTVRAEGRVPLDCEVAVLLASDTVSVDLKEKGKVLGVFWMNTGEVEIEDVPALYLLSASKNPGELADADRLEALGVGYAAIESLSAVEPAGEDKHAVFSEFIRLKEKEGLYASDGQGVSFDPPSASSRGFKAEFRLPAKTPPGEYEIRLYGFEGGEARRLAVRTVKVAKVGFTAWITSMAVGSGFLYGLLSVIIALAAGLLTGFLFGLGSKGGH